MTTPKKVTVLRENIPPPPVSRERLETWRRESSKKVPSSAAKRRSRKRKINLDPTLSMLRKLSCIYKEKSFK